MPATTWTEDLSFGSSRVLAGEQSNTSIIVDTVTSDGSARPVIIKVFRMLSRARTPTSSCRPRCAKPAASGCRPWSARCAENPWDLTAYAHGNGDSIGTPQTVHLAFAQEFLPGVQDAWRVASVAVDEGTDFTGPARLLGQATAQVHGILADALGTTPTTHDTGSAIVDEMRGRFEAAVAEVDELARFARWWTGSSRRQRTWRGHRYSASTVTITWVRCSIPPLAGGSCWTSRASPFDRSPSASRPISGFATSPACCAVSTTAADRGSRTIRGRPGRG